MTYYSNRKYQTFNYPGFTQGGETLLTGIRPVKNDQCNYYVSGWYQYPPDSTRVDAFIYKGNFKTAGQWSVLNFPSSPGVTVTATNLYGPDNYKCDQIRVVGNYTIEQQSGAIGALYEGPLNGSGVWTTLIPSSLSTSQVLNTIAHSTNGGLVVGNYDTLLIQGKAFIYDIKTKKYTNIVKEGAKSITAYGIWHNGGTDYTIAGGYTNLNHETGVDSAYLVDYNSCSHKFTNWRSYNFGNDPIKSIVTHFDGITSDGCGGYYLTGDYIDVLDPDTDVAFFAHVKRDKCGNFGKAKWEQVHYPGSQVTSGNSVANKIVIGVYKLEGDDSIYGYVSNEN